MVGEQIQIAREKLQTARAQMTGNLRIREKLFSANPGILANFQIGKRVREQIQSVTGATAANPTPRTKKGGGGERVFIDRPKGPKERVIVV